MGFTVLGIALTVKTGEPQWLFLSLPFSIMFFLAGRFAPSAYRLAGDGIHIERKAGDKVIAYGQIKLVDRSPRPVVGLSLFASRGLFGRFGRFWNPTLGLYQLFLSNTSNVVWLRTVDGWIGLSPDRPDEFAERLRGHL